jgi:hypothetical protein
MSWAAESVTVCKSVVRCASRVAFVSFQVTFNSASLRSALRRLARE